MCQCALLSVLTLLVCSARILCASQHDINSYLIPPDHLLSYQNQGNEIEKFQGDGPENLQGDGPENLQGNEIEIFEGVKQRDYQGLVGETKLLPCTVNTDTCGDLHSIKWYRGSSRIYVFSEMAGIARAEGDYSERAELLYTPNSNVSELKIKDLQVADEAVYKCEITYLEVREGCQVVQFINLTTLIKPTSVKLFRNSLAEENEIASGSRLKQLIEDDELILSCETLGGKPTPTVQWWNGSSQIHADTEVEIENGVPVAIKKIKITISRGDLGARYECRVKNDALATPLIAFVDLDVDVRPLRLNLSGVEHHVVQGTNVLLQCLVVGARPAANITWYNGTQPLPANSTKQVPQTGGTYDTMSTLSFTATRYENGGSLTCEGTNDVMMRREEVPMRDNIKLEVLYPPIVTVHPESITVNESMNVTILCHYEANPSTLKSIQWLMNDTVVKSSLGEERVASSDEDSVDSVDGTVLEVKNASRHHHGNYTCRLENDVGVSTSSNQATLYVYYKPVVYLRSDPGKPVSEVDRTNITILCEVSSGYPETLLAVRWYLDGELLKELPDCSSSNATLCDIDPSKLLLEDVERRFHGNYTCAGMNAAGWGPISATTPVVVNYPPGETSLVYYPSQVKKKGSVTLTCGVKDVGRPPRLVYKWYQGGHLRQDITSANWTIETVTLETETNYTCVAVNDGGESAPATVFFKVLAPPDFIERLQPYFGARWNDQYINLTCRVECSPLCSISWNKNGRGIDRLGAGRYEVKEVVVRADPNANTFESVRSMLVWNMTSWPGNQLDRLLDNANYSCHSSSNLVGPGVNSTTTFGVEYPPENVTVSELVVNVAEGNIPQKVLCSAKAFPEASYNWSKKGEETTVIKGASLMLSEVMKRGQGGDYVCNAYNKHGSNTQTTRFNVLYKPECGITQTERSGKMVLICSANANPEEVDFTWKVKNENETLEENVEKLGTQSYLTLESRVENFRTYLCYANNSVGISIPCERDVTGSISWWHGFESDDVMILLAIIGGTLLVVIVICVIIIIVCGRKRAADKCPNPSATKEKSDLNSSPSDALLQTDPDNKAFYENLPFHGMQNPPNKPFRPEFSDMDYADVDYKSYGPINYKAASINAALMRNAPQNHDDDELL